jgi:VIT1/CCC1 family predicted Fe2+/Mn2+ transporter
MQSSADELIEHWRDEQRSAYLYRVCAREEADNARGALFGRLAEEALAQASIWERTLAAQGGAVPAFVPDVRSRVVAALVRRIGPRRLRGVLAALKVRGMGVYDVAAAPGHPHPIGPASGEGAHRALSTGGGLRAAVFGVNDGLVSTASLIFGVAGGTTDPRVIVLTGIAGLAAGSLSMAAGEYVSVRSQRELFEHQIGLEREELAQYPEAEAVELALIYEAKGIPRDDAKRLADGLIADPEHALDTLAREELGLNPDELGSPWLATASSFAAFAGGGLIPLLPFVLGSGRTALAVAAALTAVALFAVGATLSLFTGRGALMGGLRMLAIGAAAGIVTHAIGRAFGVTLG